MGSLIPLLVFIFSIHIFNKVDTLSQRQLLLSEAESKSTHRKTFLVPPGGTQVQEPSRTVEHVEPQHKLRKVGYLKDYLIRLIVSFHFQGHNLPIDQTRTLPLHVIPIPHAQTTCKGHYGYGGFKLALTSAAEAASHLRRLAKIHSLQLFSASEPKECQVS